MPAIEEIIREARHGEANTESWAVRDHWLHFGLGVLAVVAGVLAGASGAADWERAITAVAGFGAAIFAGLQTFAKAEERSRFNYHQSAAYGSVALDAQILADRTHPPPSEDELRQLADRLTAIRERVFGEETQTKADSIPA